MIACEIAGQMTRSSWIRRMFERGRELKQKHGEENVHDFTLGNPDLPPPAAAAEALRRIAGEVARPLALGYSPNAGLPSLRERLAGYLGEEQSVSLAAAQVLVTCGAAGGLCALFRSLLEPGDEVVCPSPFFPEYEFYAAHFTAKLKTVASIRPGFRPDVAALAAAIGPGTRIILLNSPNNPTGALYGGEDLRRLAALVEETNRHRRRPLLLVADEPYRQLVYDGVSVPPFLALSRFTVVAGSFSKTMSLAGERIGYLALHPELPDGSLLADAITLNLRTLGYVNAPVIGQRMVESLLGSAVDTAVYARRRQAMCDMLARAGMSFVPPMGTFYCFPEVPGGDDAAFVDRLLERNILAVPGRGFGAPGYIRLSFAVDLATIEAAGEGFRRVAEEARQ